MYKLVKTTVDQVESNFEATVQVAKVWLLGHMPRVRGGTDSPTILGWR